MNRTPQRVDMPAPSACDNCGHSAWRVRSTLRCGRETRRYLQCQVCRERLGVSSEFDKPENNSLQKL